MKIDARTRRIAVHMLRAGAGYPRQIATQLGVSRQIVEHWARAAEIDWEGAMNRRIAAAYRRARDDGEPRQGLVRVPSKAEVRRRADRLIHEFDEREAARLAAREDGGIEGDLLPDAGPRPLPKMREQPPN